LTQIDIGWKLSFWELMKISEKGINMARLFNIKHGYSQPHFNDQLPDRLFAPLENGAHKGERIDRDEFNKALINYYKITGWTQDGVPTYGKFVELGIEEVYEL